MPMATVGTYFVKTAAIVAAPSDANDGRDPLGFGLSAATFTKATKTLAKTAAFTAYTFQSGDLIYISAGTGVTVGLYEIASRVDDDSITLTEDIGGTDPSDVASSDGPWATLQKALDAVATVGEHVRLCNDGTHTSAVQIDLDTNAGTAADPIAVKGATARGVVDGIAEPTVQASASMTNLLLTSAVADFYVFEGILFDGNGLATNVVQTGASGSTDIRFWRCRMTGAAATGYGCYIQGSGTVLHACEVFGNNGAGGVKCTSGAHPHLRGCAVHDNTGVGIEIDKGGTDVDNCLVYDNTGDGVNVTAGVGRWALKNITAFANDGDGFDVASDASPGRLTNCSAAGNGGYGYNLNGRTGFDDFAYFDHNHSGGNTSGHVDDATLNANFVTAADGNVTGDPLFTDTTDGSEDFEPKLGSPLLDAGFPGAYAAGGTSHVDIGGVQRRSNPILGSRLKTGGGL